MGLDGKATRNQNVGKRTRVYCTSVQGLKQTAATTYPTLPPNFQQNLMTYHMKIITYFYFL